MFMEMNNKKGSGGGFFDGEFGDMMKARMMANILSPGSGQEVSGTALILKGLVDSGQLGAILTEATGLLRDLASKGRDDGFEPMDVDSRDISTLPPQYRDEPKRIPPKKTPTPPTDEEYEEIPPQQKKKFAEKPQKQRPVSLPPEGVEFDNFTPEWWAKKIVERFDGTEWDVALKAAELVVKKAELSGTDMTNPNEQKEMAYGMLAIIGGAQGVVALARASKQYMEFDSNGDFKRQPEEAAEFVKEHMPDKIGVLKALDFNMMIETATHFENCKSMAKAIFFLKHPKVSQAVKRFLSTIKNSPMSRRPPSVDDGPVDDDEENPFGGF
jgi:hypothetical protein